MKFPIDFEDYKPLAFDISQKELTPEQGVQLVTNIGLWRDAIVFFTALAGVKGVGGHTGGAFDIVPEYLIAKGFARGNPDRVHPVMWDEAGHRVAIHYLAAALDPTVEGMTLEDLLHYREHGSGLPGHPELDPERGQYFASGRLGHMAGHVNGIALAHPDKKVVMFGSDGSQQEGNNAEAARLATAYGLNVAWLIDDNNTTIEGHPGDISLLGETDADMSLCDHPGRFGKEKKSGYLDGFSVLDTLKGHGMQVDYALAENLEDLFRGIQLVLTQDGPSALVNLRKMAPGTDVEGTPKGHDVFPFEAAVNYLTEHGQSSASDYLKSVKIIEDAKTSKSTVYVGSTKESGYARKQFGKTLVALMRNMTPKRREKILVFSNDLGGSVGINLVGKEFPERYVLGGVMERGNLLAAAGFGSQKGNQAVYATFAAFMEMVISELTMSVMNRSNLLLHFSHSGVDWMADNRCHYGINNLMAHLDLKEEDRTRLYFPADTHQMDAVVSTVFDHSGLRFVFSTRSPVPYILNEKGTHFFDLAEGYVFEPGKMDVIRGNMGITQDWIVSYGEMLCRSLDVVDFLRRGDQDVGLVNMPTLNVYDPDVMGRLAGNGRNVLVVESQNQQTGLGIRFGTELLRLGYKGGYDHMGTFRPGQGGIEEQLPYQKLDTAGIGRTFESLRK